MNFITPSHDAWMGMALDQARAALATSDVPIGAVVIGPGGEVLGTGRNEREATGDPTAHAEVVAIREAAKALGEWRLAGCTLVVTLEPCAMCAGAIVAANLGLPPFLYYSKDILCTQWCKTVRNQIPCRILNRI